ncbi:hypothetical protein ACVIGB_009228 [Bradyrhizobium sp. USDA 4341]
MAVAIAITSNSGRGIHEAAQDLSHFLEQDVLQSHGSVPVLKVPEGKPIYLCDNVLSSDHIAEFIGKIFRFYDRHGRDVSLEINFDTMVGGLWNNVAIVLGPKSSLRIAPLAEELPMDIATVLFSLLVTGAGLVASTAAGEFAKGAGKSAFDALKARLINSHGAASLALIDHAKDNQAYEAVIKKDLEREGVVNDPEVRRLADKLRAAIEALPEATKAPYAVNVRVIESGRSLLFDNVEGVTGDRFTSAEDMTFKNVKAPPGK